MKKERITPEPTVLKEILPIWFKVTFEQQPKQQTNEQPKK